MKMNLLRLILMSMRNIDYIFLNINKSVNHRIGMLLSIFLIFFAISFSQSPQFMPPDPSMPKIEFEKMRTFEKMQEKQITLAIKPVNNLITSGNKVLAAKNPMGAPVLGTQKYPCVLMQFPDQSNIFQKSDFQNLLFTTNGTPTGSVTDYYKEVSYGKFIIDGTVLGWYTTDNNKASYSSKVKLSDAAGCIYEAAKKADATGINWADYDNDNDGYVDTLWVVHSGNGAEETADKDNDIWSHQYWLRYTNFSEYTTNTDRPGKPGEKIKIDKYIIMPEKYKQNISGIGVYCHEFGHALGLNDLYDVAGTGSGLGYFSLMASGGWGGGGVGSNPNKPSHLDAYSKYFLGWTSPVEIKTNKNYSLDAAESNPSCNVLYPTYTATNQYFLIENRQRIGFDINLLATGMFIYHIDNNIINQYYYQNEINSNNGHAYGVALEEADASTDDYKEMHLYKGNNNGSLIDSWPNGVKKSFTDEITSIPSTKTNEGKNQYCGIKNIPASANNMSAYYYVVLMTLNTPDGGEKWKAGSIQNITWSINDDSNIVKNVEIELYKDDILISTIINSTPNDGLYQWDIPGTLVPGDDYWVLIKSVDDNLISDCSNNYFEILPTPSIVLNSPDGNEQWIQGSNHNIAWSSTGNLGNVKIELFKGGVLNTVISSSAQDTGSYSWSIPLMQNIGSDYSVKISSITNPTVVDTSNSNFAITALAVNPTLTLTSPNGNEQWVQGSTHPIIWSSTGNTGNVKIELFKAGILNTTITSSVQDTGSYSWSISPTQNIGSDYTVKISSVANPTVVDTSNANFAITALVVNPTLTLTSPNGGEQWIQGSLHTITWSSTGNPGNVKIELLKGGIYNNTIIANTTNNNSYIWLIPTGQVISKDYKVKVSAVNSATISDSSNNDFEITAPVIQIAVPSLISPVNNAVNVPFIVPLNWSSVTNATAYDIELSKDLNFTNVISLSTGRTNIYSTMANNTLYYWRVRGKKENILGTWSTIFSFTTIPFTITSGVDLSISDSKNGKQFTGIGVINNDLTMQSVTVNQYINKQSEFCVTVKNISNVPDIFIITSNSVISSDWKVGIADINGNNQTQKVFNGGWVLYNLKPGESTKLFIRLSANSGQIIDDSNPPTQKVSITAQSMNDLSNGAVVRASDTVTAISILSKRPRTQ